MIKDNLVFLKHIRDCIAKILLYTENVTYEEFSKNSMIQDAVIRQIEIIGVASSNITEEFKIKHESIPWKRMIGMRNKLIHDYFGIRLSIVWDTIENEITSLKIEVSKLLEELTPKSPLGL